MIAFSQLFFGITLAQAFLAKGKTSTRNMQPGLLKNIMKNIGYFKISIIIAEITTIILLLHGFSFLLPRN
jgi:hypothetical protein